MNFNKPHQDSNPESQKKKTNPSSLRRFLGPLIAAGSIFTGMPHQGKADDKGDLAFDSVPLEKRMYYDHFVFGEHEPSEIGVEPHLKEMAEEAATLLREAIQNNKIDQIGYNVISEFIDNFSIDLERRMHPNETKNIKTKDEWKEYFLEQIKKKITHFDISDDAPLTQVEKNKKGREAELVGMITEGEKIVKQAVQNKKITPADFRDIMGDALSAIGEGCLRSGDKDIHTNHISTAHNLTYKGTYNLFMLTLQKSLEEAKKNNGFTSSESELPKDLVDEVERYKSPDVNQPNYEYKGKIGGLKK